MNSFTIARRAVLLSIYTCMYFLQGSYTYFTYELCMWIHSRFVCLIDNNEMGLHQFQYRRSKCGANS